MKHFIVRSATALAAVAMVAGIFGPGAIANASDSSHKFKATESQALDHRGDNNGVRAWNKFALDNAYVYAKGTVTAVSANSISVSVKHHSEDGSTMITTVYTFSVDGNTKIIRKFKGTAAINQVQVGDVVSVWGSDFTNGHARLIWDQSIWWVSVTGTISALNTTTNSFTLSFPSHGITVSTTVKWDGSTTVMMGGTTKTAADLANGQKVEVRGSWDSVNSWILARKINIHS